jgi:N-(2-amino-2-carboxyethyl)-L-glutamate synthase
VLVITAPQDFHEDDLYVDLAATVGLPLFLKCEGLNLAGSVKLKAAAALIAAAEQEGRLRPGSVVVESSSGNLGVALSMIAANKGYRFVCVTDLRCNPSTRRMMEALGARVDVITEPAAEGGLLAARIDYVRSLCASDPRYVWLDQYHNAANWRAHFATTAPAILNRFPDLDVLFVGAGTTGTLMGCARYVRTLSRPVTVVAVDATGSVSFGDRPATRAIPGLGAGVRPPLLDETFVDDVVLVDEAETVATCRRLAARGFLLGGSTGTVVAGAERWLTAHAPAGRGELPLTAVAISPDLGERYLDTVYDDDWVDEHIATPSANGSAMPPSPPTPPRPTSATWKPRLARRRHNRPARYDRDPRHERVITRT